MDFIKTDWFGFENRSHIIKSRRLAAEYSHFFWPFSKFYFNEYNSVFLEEMPDLKYFKAKNRWFIRDGKIPLKSFFCKYPTPLDLKCELYIDKKWKSLVPWPWKKLIRYYELVSIRSKHSMSSILLMGQFADINSLSLLKKKLQRVREKVGAARYGQLKKYICINSPVGQTQLTQILGFKNEEVRWLNWTMLRHFNSFTEPLDYSACTAVNMGTEMIISDDFISHFILSSGGKILNLREVKREDVDILLSPYHGFCLE